jgi:hypothetical protein
MSRHFAWLGHALAELVWMCRSLAPECQRLISEDCRGLGEGQSEKEREEIARFLEMIVCEPEVTKV